MHEAIYIFAGGGTGGHLYPGLAVADELLRIERGVRVVFACSDREIDRRVLETTPHAMVPQPVVPVPRGFGGWGRFLRRWRRSRKQARQMLSDLDPRAVLGLGGFAAGPIVRQAHRMNIRAGLLNPDAVVGLANRFLARHVETIFTQFESTTQRFGVFRSKVRSVGCPVRHNFAWASKDEALGHFGLRDDRRTLLVFGGSLSADSITNAVAALAGDLAKYANHWQVLAITRREKMARLREAFTDRGIHLVVQDYCHRMDLAYEAADLAICRCGAGTAAELAVTGTPAVILPYPYHRDQQQRHNAAELVETGGVVLVDDAVDPDENAARLWKVLLPILDSDGVLGGMHEAAGRVAKAGAAKEVARWLVEGHRASSG